jgi:uncharacterized repeat protein (TIGR02543 family)
MSGELEQLVAHGTAAVAPYVRLTGYNLNDWTSSPAGMAVNNITADVVFTAQWEVAPVGARAITRTGVGQEYVVIDPANYAMPTSTVSLSLSGAPQGMIFESWSVVATTDSAMVAVNIADAYSESTTFVMPDSDVTVEARWSAVEYVYVIFDLDGGMYNGRTDNVVREVVRGGNAAPLSENPTKEGYIFEGWAPELNLTNVTEDRTFVAQWRPETAGTRTVTFNLDGGLYRGEAGPIVRTVNYGEDAEALTEDPTKDGYNFNGWFPTLNLNNVTENRVFTAQWIPVDAVTHTVTFDLDGGLYFGNPGPIVQIVEHGKDANGLSVDPTREGYRFAGWDPELNLTNVVEDLLFVAQWVQVDFDVTVTIGGVDERFTVSVKVDDKFNAGVLTGATVNVSIKNGPKNITLIIPTVIKFLVRASGVNPFSEGEYIEVLMPLNAIVRTNANGDAENDIELSTQMIEDFAEGYLGFPVEFVRSIGADSVDASSMRYSLRRIGDLVDKEGVVDRVTSVDATRLAHYLLIQGEEDLVTDMSNDGFCLVAADINMDGVVDISDLIFLSQWLVGLNDGPPTFLL